MLDLSLILIPAMFPQEKSHESVQENPCAAASLGHKRFTRRLATRPKRWPATWSCICDSLLQLNRS